MIRIKRDLLNDLTDVLIEIITTATVRANKHI